MAPRRGQPVQYYLAATVPLFPNLRETVKASYPRPAADIRTDVLRVVHLSTSDSGGGAARAAFRLHTGLRRLGVDSSMLVEERKSDDPHVTKFRPPDGLMSRLRRRARRARISSDSTKYPNRPASLDWFS